jgi:hypothetical protein
MNIWSQIARLGATVAAFAPPILVRADGDAEQVALPTEGGAQPAASLTLQREITPDELQDVDRNELPDLGTFTDPYTALLPAHPQLPPPPVEKLTGKNGKLGAVNPGSAHDAAGGRPRGWYGSGQRYG